MSVEDNSQINQEGSDTDLDEFDLAVDDEIASRNEAPADAAAAEEQGDPIEIDGQEEPGQPGPEAGAGTTDPVAAPPAPADPSDIWANAPAELREAYQREIADRDHRLSSTQGRLSAADKELARLRAERSSTSGGQQGRQQPAGQQGQEPTPAGSPFESDAVKRLREEYGEIAEPILGILQSQAEELASLRAPVNEYAQDRANQATLSQMQILANAHPDWQTYTTDPRYPEWLETQPKAIQEAASRAVMLEDGQEAAWLLGQFKQSVGANIPTPTPTPTPTPPSSSRDPRRARQLAAGRDGGAAAAPVQSGVPDDVDAALDFFADKKARERAHSS